MRIFDYEKKYQVLGMDLNALNTIKERLYTKKVSEQEMRDMAYLLDLMLTDAEQRNQEIK